MYGKLGTAPAGTAKEVKGMVTEAVENIGTFWGGMWNTLKDPFNETYYDGSEEETKDPQGVYLNEIKRGNNEFRYGMPVYLWARIEARTIERAIDEVKVQCYTEIEDPDTGEMIRGLGIINEGGSPETEYRFTAIKSAKLTAEG